MIDMNMSNETCVRHDNPDFEKLRPDLNEIEITGTIKKYYFFKREKNEGIIPQIL